MTLSNQSLSISTALTTKEKWTSAGKSCPGDQINFHILENHLIHSLGTLHPALFCLKYMYLYIYWHSEVSVCVCVPNHEIITIITFVSSKISLFDFFLIYFVHWLVKTFTCNHVHFPFIQPTNHIFLFICFMTLFSRPTNCKSSPSHNS